MRSSLPPGGHPLSDDDRASLERDMAGIVENSHLFKSLDDVGRAETLKSGYVASFHAGDIIVEQGHPGDVMYVVMHGKVRIETVAPGTRVLLAELGAGACIGEVAVLTGNERTATVTAVDDVKLVAFNKSNIERVLDGYPKVRALLQSLVEHRARDTIEKIIG